MFHRELVEGMDTHSNTPNLTVLDSRGLVVRKIGYHRTPDAEQTREDVTATTFDLAGRITELWDARLWAQGRNDPQTGPNRTHLYSLSSLPLLSASVDEGWDLSLLRESGVVEQSWETKGASWNSVYDQLSRPIAKYEIGPDQAKRMMSRCRYADGSEASAEHNQCGQVIELCDNAGLIESPEFGVLGHCLTQSRQFLESTELPDWDDTPATDAPKITHSTANALGELLTQTDASGNRQRFTQDIAGATRQAYLTLKDEAETLLLSQVKYNALGQIESETAGNGVVSTSRYEPTTGRLESISTQKGDVLSQKLEYVYDPVGNVTQITDSAQVVRYFRNQEITPTNLYRYDSLYQLVEASGRESANVSGNYPPPEDAAPDPGDTRQFLNYSETYTYDRAGNMLELRHAREGNNYTRTFAVSEASNRSVLKTDDQPAPDIDTAFDVAGNLLALQPGQGLQWGLRNQLTKIATVTRTDAANDEEVYVYDGGDQRVRKLRTFQTQSTTRSEEVFYLPGLEVRLTGTDTRTREHLEVITVQAGRSSIRCLHWLSGKPDDIPDKQIRYGLNDVLGSCSMELDANAELLNHEGYLPYGGTAWWAARSDLGGKYKTIRYSGKERDASGLYYYGYRYYAPWLQRWINPDPGGEIDGLNLYRMVGNNPISFTDSTGGSRQSFLDATNFVHNFRTRWGGGVERMPIGASRIYAPVLEQLKVLTGDEVLIHYNVLKHLDSQMSNITKAIDSYAPTETAGQQAFYHGAVSTVLSSAALVAGAKLDEHFNTTETALPGVDVPVVGMLAGVNTASVLQHFVVDRILKKLNINKPRFLRTGKVNADAIWAETREKMTALGHIKYVANAHNPNTAKGMGNITVKIIKFLSGKFFGGLGNVGGPLSAAVEGLWETMQVSMKKIPQKIDKLIVEIDSNIAHLEKNLTLLKKASDVLSHDDSEALFKYEVLAQKTRTTIGNLRLTKTKLEALPK